MWCIAIVLMCKYKYYDVILIVCLVNECPKHGKGMLLYGLVAGLYQDTPSPRLTLLMNDLSMAKACFYMVW